FEKDLQQIEKRLSELLTPDERSSSRAILERIGLNDIESFITQVEGKTDEVKDYQPVVAAILDQACQGFNLSVLHDTRRGGRSGKVYVDGHIGQTDVINNLRPLLKSLTEIPYPQTFSFAVKSDLQTDYKHALGQMAEATALFYTTRDRQPTDNYTRHYTYFSIASDVRSWLILMSYVDVDNNDIHIIDSGIKKWEDLNHYIIQILIYLDKLDLRASAEVTDNVFQDTFLMRVEASYGRLYKGTVP
ncbi:5408_t:CDS:1, partial [Paraglomus occultum]